MVGTGGPPTHRPPSRRRDGTARSHDRAAPKPRQPIDFGGRAGRIRAPSHLPRLASGKGGAADIQRNWRAFGHAIESAGLGKVNPAPGEDAEAWPPAELQGQRGHHIGTTRMSTNPKDCVVDENCRVHGIVNLYIAGSSVFPTAGAGTLTLTIVALAIRLADHLRRER